MKKALLIIVFLGLFGWVIYSYIDNTKLSKPQEPTDTIIRAEPKVDPNEPEKLVEETDEIGLREGNFAPDFELETLAGETVSLSDYRGQRVMLNFWASWCAPCRLEMPDMQKFYEADDVVILGVNLTQTKSEADNVQDFVDEFGLTFPILLDVESAVAMLYSIQPIPTTYMIDSNGRIQDKSFGPMNYEMMVEKLGAME